MHLDSGGFIVVACWNDLNNFISGKGKAGDVNSIARHEVTIKNSQDALMRYDEQIVLFPFEFQDDWLEADCEIMIRLR